MKANVFSHKQLIGTTELKIGDESMGSIFGEFLPTDYYYKEIQKFVWKFWESNKPDFEKWNSLRFNVQLENGYFLFAAGGYTFDDSPEFPNEPKRIDIAGLDRHVIEDFFLQKNIIEFIEEPWQKITIEQKIVLEDELSEAINPNKKKSFFDFLKPKQNNHILEDAELSALCKNRINDNILFTTKRKGFSQEFALTNLSDKEFPDVYIFDGFNEFKSSRWHKKQT